MKSAKTKSSPSLSPRLRIFAQDKIAFGPGKADLLARIVETGSIGDAAKQMDMSYMRAWSLVQEMNRCFKSPLVEAARGGHKRGGAELTKTGRSILTSYRKMEKSAIKAAQTDWRTIAKLLR